MAVRPDGLTPAPDQPPVWARSRAAWTLTVLASMLAVAIFGVHAWHRHHAGAAGLMAYRGIDPTTPGPDGFVIMNLRHGTPAAEAGLRRGDRVLVVDGIPANDDTRIAARIARIQRGDTLPIAYWRDGVTHTATLRFASPYEAPTAVLHLILHVGLLLAVVVVGGFVCSQRPQDPRARLFFLTSLAFASTLVAISLAFSEADPSSSFRLSIMGFMLPLSVVGIMAVIANTLFLHFTAIFPRPTPWLAANPARVAWLYLPAAMMLSLFTMVGMRQLVRTLPLDDDVGRGLTVALATGLALAAFAFARRGRRPMADFRVIVAARPGRVVAALALAYVAIVVTGSSYVPDRFEPAFTLAVIVVPITAAAGIALFVYTLLASVALLHAYRTSRADERRQVKWPLWGLFVMSAGSLVMFAFSLLVPTLERRGWLSREPSAWLMAVELGGWLLLALFPFPFAAAILRYRLMDIDVIIRRTIVYAIASTIVVGLLVLLAGGLGGIAVQTLGVRDTWVTIACTLAVGVVFVPLRNRIDAAVARRVFHRRGANEEVIRQLRTEAATQTDTQTLRQLVVERLAEAMQLRSLVLYTRPQRETVFWASAKVGAPDSAIGRLRLDAARVGRLSSAIPPDAAGLDAAERAQLAELACTQLVPVTSKGSLLAFFCVGPRIDDRALDEDDHRLLEGAARELATGILAIRERRTDREAVDAYEIQRGLLPRRLPDIPPFRLAGGWKPAAIVSGDYYTAFQLGEWLVGLCIADVSGKGMPAALIMSNVQAALKAIATPDLSPATVCQRLNASLAEHIAAGRFVTFVYGLLDIRTRTLRYVNAGHNPPLLVQASEAEPRRLDVGGMALGFFEGATYQEGHVTLPAGSRLVFYTDGVVEARNPAGEEYGDERLVADVRRTAHLPATDQVDVLLATVTAFAAGELGDDATMLVVEAW